MKNLEELLHKNFPELAKVFSVNDLQADPASHSTVELLGAALEKKSMDLSLTSAQQQSITQLFAASTQPDPHTGFDKSLFKELDFALAAGKADRQDVFYVGADLSNLRGLNLALSGSDIVQAGGESVVTDTGRKATDKAMAAMAGFMREGFQTVTKETPGAYATFYRDGGDELSAVVSGVSQQQLESALEGIRTRVVEFVDVAGLSSIAHPKYPKLGSERSGAGLAISYAKVDPESLLSDVSHEVDERIELEKSDANSKAKSQPIRNRLTKDEISKAVQVIGTAASSLPIAAAKVDFPFADRVVLEKTPGGAGDFVWPSLRRRMQTESTVKSQAFAPQGKELLENLLDVYEATDPATGARRNSAVGTVQSGLDFLRHKPQENMHALTFEMQNFAGMNQLLGHERTDRLFGEFASKIDLRTEESQVFRPEGRGDRIYVVARGLSSEQIAGRVAEISDAVNELARDNRLNALPNPRYPDKADNGVRFVVAATKLESGSQLSAGSVLSELDNQIQHNRSERKVFDPEMALGVDSPALGYSPGFLAAEMQRRAEKGRTGRPAKGS